MAGVAGLFPVTVAADDSCNSPLVDPAGAIACGASDTLGNVAGNVLQFGADQAVHAVTKWVVDTAVWLLGQLVNVIFNTTSPVLSVDWFRAHYADMVAVAWVVAPIFLLLGVVQAILRSDLGLLGRIVGQLVVVALMTTGAVFVAQLLIGTVDQLSGFVARNSNADLHRFLSEGMSATMTAAMMAAGNPTTAPAAVGLPQFFLFLSGVLTVLGGILIWLELIARTLVIYAAMLFFPVLLAAALWPRASGMVQILAEVLVAVILSKFIIVVIVAAGAAALTATGTSGAAGSQNAAPSLLIGAGLLLVAAWAPWKFYRLMPTLEAAMVHQVGRPFYQSWQQGQQHLRRATGTPSRTHQLPIAGNHNRPPGPKPRPPVPKPPLPVNPLVTVTSLLTGAARNRVGGISLAGWQRHAGSGIVTPSSGTTRNPRPATGGGGKP